MNKTAIDSEYIYRNVNKREQKVGNLTFSEPKLCMILFSEPTLYMILSATTAKCFIPLSTMFIG
jgi:hypothetical protein